MRLSDKSINRLSLYHNILRGFLEKGEKLISSRQIASLLRIDDSQVRKDISYLKNPGKCRVGYNVLNLKEAIEKNLGFSTTKNAFIIGAGNLGFALTKYDNFSNYGLNILALFDTDPLKIDVRINNKQVFHLSRLPEMQEKMGVELAILTVPYSEAQKTAENLVHGGIKYIWNFTPAILETPEYIQVWNENLMGSFLQFTYNFVKDN